MQIRRMCLGPIAPVLFSVIIGENAGCGSRAVPPAGPAQEQVPAAASSKSTKGDSSPEESGTRRQLLAVQSYCEWLPTSKTQDSGYESIDACVKRIGAMEARIGVQPLQCWMKCSMKTDFGAGLADCLKSCENDPARSAVAYLAGCSTLIKGINEHGDAIKAATGEYTASARTSADMKRFSEKIRAVASAIESIPLFNETLKSLSARYRDMLEKLASAAVLTTGSADARARALAELDAVDATETRILEELNEYCVAAD